MFRFVTLTILCTCAAVPAYSQVYISPSGNDTTGDSWANAFTSVAAGVAAGTSQSKDVWIAAGTYNISAMISLSANMAVYGGFPAAGNPGFADRNPTANLTTLDGLGANHIFQCDNVANVVIDGLGFTRALGVSGPGGAIRVVNSASATITNCDFFDNGAIQYGAGIYVESAHADVSRCVFMHNSAPEAGALMLFQATANVSQCTFQDNSGGGQGGAILVYVQPIQISRCIFDSNTASRGGAVAVREGIGGSVVNSLFVNNASDDHGAGVNLESQLNFNIVNCTFVDNTATTRGGGVFLHDSGGYIANNIFSNNNKSAIYENSAAADPIVRNNLFFNNPDGVYFDEATTAIATAGGSTGLNSTVHEAASNLDGDPRFVDEAHANYHILRESSALNTGTSNGAPADDIDGDTRTGAIDIGFDEANVTALKSGGCFIATAAYGTPLAAELGALRDARDEFLLGNPLGAAFADGYYRVSPAIAQRIAADRRLAGPVRVALAPVVVLVKGLLAAPRSTIAIAGAIALLAFAMRKRLARRSA